MSSGVYKFSFIGGEDVSMCGIRIHPAALHTCMRITRHHDRDYVTFFPKKDSDSPGSDRLASVSGSFTAALQASPAQAAAAAALYAYIHEACEHFAIDGYPLNQHYKTGLENTVLTLREYVLPWLQRVLDNGQYYPDPDPAVGF